MTRRLSKKETADALAVSPRTVERYVREGRLIVYYQRGRTRPIATFDPNAVKALHARISIRPEARPAGNRSLLLDDAAAPILSAMSERPDSGANVLGVRLPDHYRLRLEEAAAAKQVPVSAYARRLLIDALEGNADPSSPTETLTLSEEIGVVSRAVEMLRSDLALIAMALLIKAGRCSTTEANDWLITNLGKDPLEAPTVCE